jgi:glyceraldehyde-3-phosphate dehydrogenase (NAD(P))
MKEDHQMARQGTVRVAVNGYGVIGKRVADAVALQDDMALVGVADVAADYRVRVAVARGYPVYAAASEARTAIDAAGIPLAGTLDDLVARADVVVDCAPKKVAAANRERYAAAGVKAVWQGGEKHELAGYSFVAQVNYAGALGRDAARVVSCNTTALCRVLGALHARGLVKKARATLMRRATDPWESHLGGMINTIVPETTVPSHQGPDARTVIPDLPITTVAASGPFNLSHVHFAMVELTRPAALEEVRAVLAAAPRIAFVRAGEGLSAANAVIELMRDLGRPRADMWEVALFEEALAVQDGELFLTFQVHNEAIVIPETIDCIRAVTGLERDRAASIAKTDRSLGVLKTFLPGAARQAGGAGPCLAGSAF